jgi:xylulose-5-phosphate/fructose-6-phosphate phosphoketolase
MVYARLSSRIYTREHGEDDPRITDWTWRTGVADTDGEIK